jgi:hypothetical protein
LLAGPKHVGRSFAIWVGGPHWRRKQRGNAEDSKPDNTDVRTSRARHHQTLPAKEIGVGFVASLILGRIAKLRNGANDNEAANSPEDPGLTAPRETA